MTMIDVTLMKSIAENLFVHWRIFGPNFHEIQQVKPNLSQERSFQSNIKVVLLVDFLNTEQNGQTRNCLTHGKSEKLVTSYFRMFQSIATYNNKSVLD